MRFSRILTAGPAIAALVSAGAAGAAVVRVDESNFNAAAGVLTFSEFPTGSVNPVYAPADYGGGVNAPTVTTGGYFEGQSLSDAPAQDCPGASATACITGAPSGPLTLDAGAPETSIAIDSAFPTSPTLSGTPRFNGPIALLFSDDQLAVGFDGGFFDSVRSTGITAFGRDGGLLGTVANETRGIEFLGLVSADGAPEIAGVFLNLVGSEPAGFNIDNVRFGVGTQIDLPPEIETPDDDDRAVVPLPAGLPLLLGALGLLGVVRRRPAD